MENKTIRRYLCCDPSILKFISDYINSIIGELNLKLLIINTNIYTYNETDIYIFVQRIPVFLLNKYHANILLLNIEQCTRNNFKEYISSLLEKNINVIDYSFENVKYLNNKNMNYLPYQYTNQEINRLRELIINTSNKSKTYDVVFLGFLSPKRKKIYDDLEFHGIKMLNINNKWGNIRDIEISSAKILLNIHFADDYDIYEVLRCDRLILSGMMVISEKSINNNLLDVNDLVIFEDYNNLVNKVIDIINNYDIYHNNFLNKYNDLINGIKLERYKQLTNLDNILMEITNTIESSQNDQNDKNIQNPISNKMKSINKSSLNKNLVNNTLELFSANWVCNVNRVSYIKLGDNIINLFRGLNLLVLKENQLFHVCGFDTCLEDFSGDIQKYVKNIYDSTEFDYLILITHDDATHNTNMKILQNYLIFLDCQKLCNLTFRGSYLLIYDLKKNKNICEICDNQFPIHEWFELVNEINTNNNYKLVNLGIPVYLIVYNLSYFVKNSVKQLEKYTKNIHIIDNKSEYPNLLEYYDKEYNYFLHKMDANYGHLVWMRQMYWQFPKIFALSDPDLEYNINLPSDFLTIMKNLTIEYKRGKVGFALDLSDHNLFFKETNYCEGLSIYEWEKRFWLRKINHSKYELYDAGVDTTFCVVNKSYPETNNAIRMGGEFTCKHIPWYDGWHKKLDKDEWKFYKNKNISSSTVKMILKTYNECHVKNIKLFNDINELINNVNEIISRHSKESSSIEINKDLNNCIAILNTSKDKISTIIRNNASNIN